MPASPPASRLFRRYLLLALAEAMILLLLPPLLLCLRGLSRLEPMPYAALEDFAYDPRLPAADVVILGDSSALFGLDPRRLARQLGVSVLNLPNTGPTLAVTGTLALDRYLERHPAPQVLVVYVTAWNLDFLHAPPRPEGLTGNEKPHLFEGIEPLLRHGTPAEILSFIRLHPAAALAFPFKFDQTLLEMLPLRLAGRRGLRHELERSAGHLDADMGLESLSATCTLPQQLLAPAATRTVAELAHRYQTAQTQLLIYIAPLPGCGNAGVIAGRAYGSYSTAPPQILPPEWFSADPSYAHLKPAHVADATDALSDRLKPLLKTQSLSLLKTRQSGLQ